MNILEIFFKISFIYLRERGKEHEWEGRGRGEGRNKLPTEQGA